MIKKSYVLWGISAIEHDAALSVIKDDQIVFAAHSERYSRIKNDAALNEPLIEEAISYAGLPDYIIYYEDSYLSNLRKYEAGRIGKNYLQGSVSQIETELSKYSTINKIPILNVHHHEAHAAGGFFTSPFQEALIVVVDAVGELETLSIWEGHGNSLVKIFSLPFPHSIGLFYSAITDRLHFKPNEEEFIIMALAAFGNPNYVDILKADFIFEDPIPLFRLKKDLYKGIRNWRPEIINDADVAASAQKIIEDYILNTLEYFQAQTKKKYLVFSGGVALNCVLNYKIRKSKLFEDIWIMPNPGDAGSSLGAALAYLRKHITFETAYLGTDINREVDVKLAVSNLADGEIIGIANGRAEFGPRALGNRSVLADPRKQYMKEKVNEIKMREAFRPFAPIVLAELSSQYFDMDFVSPYMQCAVPCRQPDALPAVCHVDGSSRVQTIDEHSKSATYHILKEFYNLTGCPVLLNTSLNVKGEPIVNTWNDAIAFQDKCKIRIY